MCVREVHGREDVYDRGMCAGGVGHTYQEVYMAMGRGACEKLKLTSGEYASYWKCFLVLLILFLQFRN